MTFLHIIRIGEVQTQLQISKNFNIFWAKYRKLKFFGIWFT